MSEMIVTTMNDPPGYRVETVIGEVFGLTVRSRHIGSDIGASLKGLVGGEVKGYTKMLADSRNQALERLRETAAGVGANAVVAMRFDCNGAGNMTRSPRTAPRSSCTVRNRAEVAAGRRHARRRSTGTHVWRTRRRFAARAAPRAASPRV